ncbi:unnamed protein product [Meloidogyne enterolobii]|uniref:Uncharacterized protein n=1 Tax=Meloidogyne enterolobii TaxID=390850 RepID=A0ACB0XUQ1_MELEN
MNISFIKFRNSSNYCLQVASVCYQWQAPELRQSCCILVRQCINDCVGSGMWMLQRILMLSIKACMLRFCEIFTDSLLTK